MPRLISGGDAILNFEIAVGIFIRGILGPSSFNSICHVVRPKWLFVLPASFISLILCLLTFTIRTVCHDATGPGFAPRPLFRKGGRD